MSTQSFAEAIEAAAELPGVLRAFGDGSAADAAVEAAPNAASAALLTKTAGGAPFLGRLLRRDANWLSAQWTKPPEQLLLELASAPYRLVEEELDQQSWMARLRAARRHVALITALGDLAGVYDLKQVTGCLSDFAEAATDATLQRLLTAEAARGKIEFDPAASGMFALSMGKLGARELNYSSDIDLIVLFDPDSLPDKHRMDAKERFVRVTRDLVRIMSDATADGYVARVDLRLRPDPASTPVCLSTEAAEVYYESMGRPWERAAHIKARVMAGDRVAGAEYLKRLSPFIWRRHLDFAAIEDAADMLARIREHEGGAEVAVAGQDVKLGAGGIREIEFLAQTQQIILGGRNPSLRTPRTQDALYALAEAGRIPKDVVGGLDEAYVYLRTLEHRLQMVEDQQTHRMPNNPEGLDRIAALMGFESRDRLFEETFDRMRRVRHATTLLDKQADRGAAEARETSAAAAGGFPDPEKAQAIAESWLEGRIKALRSERAQGKIRRLTPEIMEKLAAADDPMRALVEFDRFLTGLPAGVQILSLFEAAPWLVDLVTQVCAAAPRLSKTLSRRPNLLDAVLDADFFAPPPDADVLSAEAAARLARESDYESRLDAVRRWSGERQFQIGLGLLRGQLGYMQAQEGFSNVAEASLRALWPHVEEEHARKYGDPPGEGAAALALGKLGSSEMTAGSDLDLILIYDSPLDAASNGERSLYAAQYYARFTQTLVSAVTAPTADGVLYEIDMRLRPSGNSGPVATSLEAFKRYQKEDAWVWEHMALTRARPIIGRPAVMESARAAIQEALSQPREAASVLKAAAEMRDKLRAAHPNATNRWAMKYAPGGLVDLEFIAQAGALSTNLSCAGGLSASAGLALLAEAGELAPLEAAELQKALALQSALHQMEKVALEGPYRPDSQAEGMRELFLSAARKAVEPSTVADFTAMEAELDRLQARASAVFKQRIGGA